ncbi:hypothetical protein PLUTE_a0763 [Pseudoalteromonas luteoviolacea DSM 6061]|nr:hypothetical protein [Pseudoalteromonas luteoviolacea DSM 6061]
MGLILKLQKIKFSQKLNYFQKVKYKKLPKLKYILYFVK